MKKRIIFLLAIGIFFIPGLSEAYDINYASVESIAGDSVLLKYRTTEGYTFALCSVDGDCGKLLFGENMDNNVPSIFPSIMNQKNYTKSPDGRLAVVNMANIAGNTYRSLYRIDGEDAKYVKMLPFYEPVLRTSISYAGDAIIFLGNGGVITRYDIDENLLSRVSTGRSSFPFWSTSEHGNYVASYNYANKSQEIWHIGSNGKVRTVPAEIPSYVVFSENEETIAYLNEVDGYNKLFVSKLSDASNGRDVKTGDYTVVEYEFLGDTLYYVANTESDPYTWNLYSFDMRSGKVGLVDGDVAYDDSFGNLKKTSDALFYEKVDGRNKNVVMLDLESKNTTTITAVTENLSPHNINKEIVDLDGVPGVLLSPESVRANDELPLIVWLHGGPMRQTSADFHPFYGYAVYDEILERLATEAYVLKLDYTGSWGHGNEFREALVGNIGKLDVQDVFNSIDEIKDEKDIEKVYLIGNSYGGYLALRSLVENPDDVEAVVSIAGVTDWDSLITRIPSSPFSNSFYGPRSAANAKLYNTASIINRLNNIDDQEMLVVYGDMDSSVPTWQSTEFSATATALGKNIDLVRYEGEGHTILKKNNLIDLCERTTAVFSLSSSICRE